MLWLVVTKVHCYLLIAIFQRFLLLYTCLEMCPAPNNLSVAIEQSIPWLCSPMPTAVPGTVVISFTVNPAQGYLQLLMMHIQ